VEHRFVADVPPATLGAEAVLIDFSLDRYLAAGTVDNRELGIIVTSVALEPK
jgi:hypothetical protein